MVIVSYVNDEPCPVLQAPERLWDTCDVIIWAVLHKVKTLQRRRGRECGMVDRAHALS